TVALGALAGMLAPTLDEVDDLVTLDLINHLGLHSRVRNERHAYDGLVTAQHQNLVELNFFTGVGSKFFNPEHVARLNLVLLATGLEDRKHLVFLRICRALWSPVGSFRPCGHLELRARWAILSVPRAGCPSPRWRLMSAKPGQ